MTRSERRRHRILQARLRRATRPVGFEVDPAKVYGAEARIDLLMKQGEYDGMIGQVMHSPLIRADLRGLSWVFTAADATYRGGSLLVSLKLKALYP